MSASRSTASESIALGLEWVVDALRASEMVEGIAVVVPSAEDLGSWADKPDKLVVSSRSSYESM